MIIAWVIQLGCGMGKGLRAMRMVGMMMVQ